VSKVSHLKEPEQREAPTARRRGFSRRGFIQGAGVTGAIAPGMVDEAQAQGAQAPVMGPGAVPITLTVNGKPMNVTVEPRQTLLDTLRYNLDLTGAKRVCDRGTCGACTVLVNGKVMYACSMLAVDAVGKQIVTVEGLAMPGGRPHPVVQAFVDHDAQQCGYCTPGFVVAAKAFLDRTPSPSYEQVQDGLGGNLCRCGTYVGIRRAVLQAAKSMKAAPAKEAANA
jgi:xanthine dehydrogenase YagT iron-sulfur-binding subunit